jgi:hypothetical protein
MGTFGINMNEFEGKAPGNWTPPDPGTQTFEIMGVTEGVNGKGEHAGERYLSARCVQTSGDEPGTKSTGVYLGLSAKDGQYGKPIEQTVGYLKAWGRMDILENGEDSDVNDLIGTIFEADVKIKTQADGTVKVNLGNVKAVSHAEEPAPPPQAVKAPAVMRRGR